MSPAPRNHLHVVLLALVACGGAPPPSTAPPAANEIETVTDPGGDAAFQAAVRSFAAEREETVRAWGVAPIAAGQPVRFATLTSTDPAGDRGAYVLQDLAGSWYRLDFTVDGRTRLWPEADAGATEPTWVEISDGAVVMWQGWRGGYDQLQVTVQDGTGLVLAEREVLDDARDSETPHREVHATDGRCTGQCPPVPIDGPIEAARGPGPDLRGL